MSDFQQRRARVAEMLAELRVDAMLVSGAPNVRYLSGYTGSNGLMLLEAGRAILFTDPRYTIQAAAEVDCSVKIAKGSLYAAAAKWMDARKWKRVVFERNRIGWGAYAELQETLRSGVQLKPASGVVERLRMVKSEAEIALIRESVNTNSQAFETTVKRMKPGMSEAYLAAELDYRMRRLGAEQPAFETIVAAGERTALPHARPTHGTTTTDRLILIDMGAFRAGYASDMTRMLHQGQPGRKTKALYQAVLEAQLAAIDAVREGVTAQAVDRKARAVLNARGYGKQFVHSTGHGLGLEIHEPPRLGKKDKTRLEAGMTITIEPGAYIEGFGGVRIEDTVLVTRNGCEVLTPTAKELIIV